MQNALALHLTLNQQFVKLRVSVFVFLDLLALIAQSVSEIIFKLLKEDVLV